MICLAARLYAATLEVHSEFLRVDPQGEILAIDSTPKPREILSPALVRNGFASFHVVVRSERPESYFLYVASNPANVFRMTLYKEEFVKRGENWIPDTLRPLRAPNFGAIPDGEAGIAGQTACVYLLDIWVPPNTAAGTVRVEALIKVGSWIVYPMEVRVLPVKVPASRGPSPEPLPDLDERADQAASGPLLRYLGGEAPPEGPASVGAAPRTVREVIRRNAEQDMALARALDSKIARPALRAKVAASEGGGEWYLAIRDLIYRLSSRIY